MESVSSWSRFPPVTRCAATRDDRQAAATARTLRAPRRATTAAMAKRDHNLAT